MNATEMIELRMRHPFVPFEVRLADGSSIHVAEPNLVATARNSGECTIFESAERIRFIRFKDIRDVVLHPATTNGSTD
jgi:hypothetical protein